MKRVPLQWYRDSFSKFTPSASVNFRWNEQAMTYLSYSEGFKGGGWNSHFNSVLTPEQQAAPAGVQAREGEELSRSARSSTCSAIRCALNFAIFDSRYTDMQVTYRGPARCRCRAVPDQCGQGLDQGRGDRAHLGAGNRTGTSRPASVISESRIDRLDITPLAVIPPDLQRWQ